MTSLIFVFVAYFSLNDFVFVFLFVSVPFKYEALMDDYLNLGNSDSSKNDKYAPVYPIFRIRPIKRRQNIDRNSESSLD